MLGPNCEERRKRVISLIAEQKNLIEQHRAQQALVTPDMTLVSVLEIKARLDVLAEKHLAISAELQRLIFAPMSQAAEK